MALDPEVVQKALFDRMVAKVTGLKLTARRFLSFADIDASHRPAMLVLGVQGAGQREYGAGTMWTMHAMVVFHVSIPTDKAISVETALFGYMKQLDAALQRQANEEPEDDPGTTLGGLLFRCFRRDYALHHGDEVDQAAISMTIEMVAPE